MVFTDYLSASGRGKQAIEGASARLARASGLATSIQDPTTHEATMKESPDSPRGTF